MGQIVFDDDIARRLEVVYRTRDMLRRRRLVREALAPQRGERILDVGCGPGFYVAELLEEVGPEGFVAGVDNSPPMLAAAARRCEANDNVAFHEGEATSLPVDEEAFDAAVCVQVLEYVADPTAALAEMHRALRPGGRVVVWDVDWSTLSWHSSDPARMQRILDAWDQHLTHASLPRTLGARLAAAGFSDVAVDGHPFVSTELDPETYGAALVPLVAKFAADRGELEAGAWADEQRTLSERGEFFFACTQFCFAATRPG
jgi:arsenite methyltransferase